MAQTPSSRLQSVGFPTGVADEINAQIQAKTGDLNRLLGVGLPVQQATALSPMITSGTRDANLLIASGMSHVQASTLAGIQFGVAPSNTAVPEITGTPQVGETLTLSNGTWDGDTPRTFSRVWKRDGADISGATATTYDLVAEDEGTTISATVTLTNNFGTASADAEGVGPVIPA